MFGSPDPHLRLSGIRLSRRLHAAISFMLLLCISWGLLSPDPFSVVRDNSLSWICRLDDMILHWGAFTLLSTAIASFSLRWLRTVSPVTLGALCLYAVATELLQTFIVGRTCDPADALANALGIATGVGVTLQLWSRLQTVSQRSGSAI